MRDVGLVVLVDGEDPRLPDVRRLFGSWAGGIGGSAGRIEHLVGVDSGAVLEQELHAVAGAGDGVDVDAEVHGHTEAILQLADEHAHDLAVDVAHERRASVDEVYLHAEGGEDGGILGSDHAGADYGEHLRDAVDVQDRVAVADELVVERYVGRAVGRGAGGDENLVAFEDLIPDFDLVRGAEARDAAEVLDAVAAKVPVDPLPLPLDDYFLAVHEGVDGDFFVYVDVDGFPIVAGVEVGEVEGRLAQGLGGDGSGVHARPAEDGLALDERHALAEVGRLRRALLAGRSGADDDEIVHSC